LPPPVGKNHEERSCSGWGILSLSSSVCPLGSGEQPGDIVVRMGYAASVAENALSGGTGMIEVSGRFAD